MKRLGIFFFLSLMLVAVGFAGKKKDNEQFCDIKIKVVKEATGKPVRNAAVILHAVNDKGKQETGGLNLKTDANGEAVYNAIPYGRLRVQVIVAELQTYGDDLVIDQPQKEIVIKMKAPQKQYSIYEDHPGDKPPEQEKK